MKVISLVSSKGGVGKSTSALYFAYILSKNYKVLLIDMDNQNSLTRYFISNYEEIRKKTILDALLGKTDLKDTIKNVSENLDFIPSDDLLETLDTHLKTQREYKLFYTLKPIMNIYDYIIIDSPPNLPVHSKLAISMSNYILVPTLLSDWEIDTIPSVINYIKTEGLQNQNTIQTSFEKFGIIPTMVETGRSVSITGLERLKEEYGNDVLDCISKREEIKQQKTFRHIENLEKTLAYQEYTKILKSLNLYN